MKNVLINTNKKKDNGANNIEKFNIASVLIAMFTR